jgi:hypothetical protein
MVDFTWDGPTLTDGAKYKVELGNKGDCNSGSKTLTYHKPTGEMYGTVNQCGNVKDGDTCNTFMTQLSKSDERMVQCTAEGAATHSGKEDTCIADDNFEYYGVRSCPGGPGTTTTTTAGPKGPTTSTTGESFWSHYEAVIIVAIVIFVICIIMLGISKYNQ